MSQTASATANPTDCNDSDGGTATSANPPHYLMWFRRDLRVHDNTALAAICERANEDNARVSAIFFLTPKQWQAHDTSLVQVDHIARTLPILAKALQEQLNIKLTVQVCPSFSDSIDALLTICNANNISAIMANHEYEGNEIDRDEQLTEQLAKSDIEFVRWHDQCILPPQTITTNDGDSMYQVFTPFYKKWRHTLEVSDIQMHEAPAVSDNNNVTLEPTENAAKTVAEIESLSTKTVNAYQKQLNSNETDNNTDASTQLENAHNDYPAGETAACQRLEDFIAEDINNYDVSRDVPSLHATSQLSAYLTIGAISPRLCYLQAHKAQEKLHGNDSDNNDINRWISELAWRDFYRHVLDYKPELIRHQAYKHETDTKINWSYNTDDFNAWCKGMTGVPLVDAAMRCLNATGFMHNRLRMVTAMFLTKDLLIDWRWGERYFMQQLIDGDFASNNGGWQWSASTGTDSAPYFRIMNPFSQAKTHDAKGEFIKTWLPELKDIPATILHSEEKMRKALGKKGDFADTDYPVPMVEHKAARLLTIAEFKKES
ncbi:MULTISPECIES: FAD-binding domain-containing protein [unclassified Psychrobacter]|uniref:cryptochrome/photolyase family protein n=1 Tax=unclassified Psychrobacter TaxID=196806 RepID=UPI0025B4B534|nr:MULTISPECIES: FAD-binding domain-containing protein [unclassified Psychrobacter]MDN3452246.1 FAD-binding domain-containing protein [Psychrobacter sp. APC 3350]MDN3502137.1 FAD-binding domain-containing protein [Psychrobacter sp. 5A.1]